MKCGYDARCAPREAQSLQVSRINANALRTCVGLDRISQVLLTSRMLPIQGSAMMRPWTICVKRFPSGFACNHLVALAFDLGWFPLRNFWFHRAFLSRRNRRRRKGAMSKFPVGILVLGASCLLLVLATAPSSTAQARSLHMRVGGGPIGIVRSVASLAFRGLHGRRGE